MDGQTFRESLTSAIGYWERRRIVFNIVLAAIVLAYFGIHYPASKTVLSVNFALILFILAVLANIAYCAAYFVDVFAQSSGYREEWQKRRWILFLVGMLFAGVITRFFAMGMFQS
jgi:hypothetical protein